MNVLVVGAGMYVTGRGGFDNPTVLATLAQFGKESAIGSVVVAARNAANASLVEATVATINARVNGRLEATFHQLAGHDLEGELSALCAARSFDAAIVAVPDDLHAAALRALLKARVHSLVVKPFVPTVAEARELLHLQQEHAVYGAVEFHKRFDESNLYAKKLLGRGGLGEVRYISVAYSQRVTIPTIAFREWAARTNIFQYLGVHYVDIVYFLTGFLPVQLTAYGTRGLLEAHGIDTFDSVHVMLEWAHPDGAAPPFVTHFDTNWIDPESTSALSDQRLTIVGTKGRLELDQKDRGITLVTEDDVIVHVNPYFSTFLIRMDGHEQFHGYGYRSISQFLRDVYALRAGATTVDSLERERPTFRQALVSTAVVDAVSRALKAPPAWWPVDDPR